MREEEAVIAAISAEALPNSSPSSALRLTTLASLSRQLSPYMLQQLSEVTYNS
jgi:hypothetical protein